MNCQHIDERNPTQSTHTLPCRDKLCMDCLLQISDLFKGNVFSCPLCGNYAQYVDTMIESIRDETLAHHTNRIGQTKEEVSPHRIPEVTKGDQRRDEALERSVWYDELKKGDPPHVHESDKNFATSYSADGYSSYNQCQSPSIPHSQQQYPRQLRDDHSGFKDPTHSSSMVTGTQAYHQKEYPDHHGSATIQRQEAILARCQQNKANSEMDFQVDNRRNIPDNYRHFGKAQGMQKADNFCSEHKQSHVYFECETCNKLVCRKCVNTMHHLHKWFIFESPGENSFDKQSIFCHDCTSETRTDEVQSKSKSNHQDRYQSPKDEDFPGMDEIDKQEQRKLLEEFEQMKLHNLPTQNDTHVPSQSPRLHEYNLRSRSAGRASYREACMADTNTVESKRGDRFCIDHPGSEVYFFCKTCDKLMCGKCTTEKHKGHAYRNFDQSEAEETNEVMCDLHNLLCTMYCVQCNIMICTSCSKDFKYHRFHGTSDLEKAKEEITHNSMKCLQALEKNTEACDKLNRLVDKEKEDMQKQADELKQKIIKEAQRAHDEIESIAAEQIAKIEEELERCMKPRNDLNAKIVKMTKELVDNKETITTALKLLSENDLPNAAVATRSVDDDLQRFTNRTKIGKPPERFDLRCKVNGIARTKDKAPFLVYKLPPPGNSYYFSTYI